MSAADALSELVNKALDEVSQKLAVQLRVFQIEGYECGARVLKAASGSADDVAAAHDKCFERVERNTQAIQAAIGKHVEAIDGCRKTASDKVRPDIEALAKKYGDGGALPEAAKEALEGKFMTSLRPCVEKQVAELKKLPTTIRLS